MAQLSERVDKLEDKVHHMELDIVTSNAEVVSELKILNVTMRTTKSDSEQAKDEIGKLWKVREADRNRQSNRSWDVTKWVLSIVGGILVLVVTYYLGSK